MSDTKKTIEELNRVIKLIETDSEQISPETKKQMVAETLEHFDNYVSPGWLKYRKSVSSDTEEGAVLEWQDEGAYCYGLNGEKFIDCLGGFGIFTCGHRNPQILKTVKAQLDHQALHSQELLDPLRGYLAKAVAQITPGDLQYCFFTNGGAEAVEMALKLARIATGGRWYISTVGAFHGKSMGAVSMGGKGTYRIPYAPMVQQVQHVEYGNADDIRKAITNLQTVGEKVAAVILEPIQGEAGVIIPPKGYLAEVREICDEKGVALIFDEIQTGMGRTGTMWRCEAEGVTPDIMTFGKAFGGGIMPITGIICKPEMWTQQLIDNPWLLGSPTFGGNPVCCAAAIATIKYMLENDVPGTCKFKGDFLKAGLSEFKTLSGKAQNQPNPKINENKIRLSEIENEINEFLSKVTGANEVLMNYINDKIEALDRERKELQAEIISLENYRPKQNVDVIKNHIDAWEQTSFDDKKSVLDAMIKVIHIADGNIEIEWNL